MASRFTSEETADVLPLIDESLHAPFPNAGDHQRSGNDTERENLPVSFREASVAAAASSTPSTSSGPRGESGERGDGDNEVSSWRPDLVREQSDIITRRPKTPHMAVPHHRISSYSDWPHKGTHPPDEMAKAGFYYTGIRDVVRCFYCHLQLEGWTPSDQPWVEHSRWLPCAFVLLNKGQSFVDAVQRLDSASNLPKISEDLMMYCVCRCDNRFPITEEQVMHEMRIMNHSKKRNSSQSAAVLSSEGRAEVPKNTDLAMGVNMHENRHLEDRQEDGRGEGERLEDEQKEKRNLAECVCCQEEVNVLFHPCGHFVACAQCAPALETCAMCRQRVEGLVRISLD